VHKVPDGVVTNDQIPGESAAGGVVAINIDGLHAHRTRDGIFQQRDTKAVGDGDTEVAGTKDGVVPVYLGRHRRDEAPSVGLGDAAQPLSVPAVRLINQELPDLLVKGERSALLGHVLAYTKGLLPLLHGLLLCFVPTSSEGQIGVLNRLAETKTTELGCEGCLRVSEIGHREPENVLGGLAEHPIELAGFGTPLTERGRPHKVNRPHDGERDPQKVEGRLGVFEIDELTDGGLQPAKKLLFDEIANEGVRAKRDAQHLDLSVRNKLDLTLG